MKILFYSDLHIRPETEDACRTVLRAVGEIAKIESALIVNCGDTFNHRGIMHTSSFQMLSAHWYDWHLAGLKQIILVGNHDQQDREGEVHPMSIFKSWEGWEIVDVPKIIHGIAFFPYMTKDKIKAAIDESFKEAEPELAVVHWGIQGAMRNDSNVDSDGVPFEWLKGFETVVSGHYHFRNSFGGKVHYVGSPYQQNFGESGQDKGCILYDTDTDEFQFIEITDTPKYYKTEAKCDQGIVRMFTEDKVPPRVYARDHLMVTMTGDEELLKTIDTNMFMLETKNVKIIRHAKAKAHSRLGIEQAETSDPIALMKKYIDFIETTLDRKKLLKMGEEFVQI